MRYEKKVLDLLPECFPGFIPSPWFEFVDHANYVRWCQPDGLWRGPGGEVILFEVKLRFTTDAFFQLTQLYAPVVRMAFGPAKMGFANICRFYDPLLQFPEKQRFLSELTAEEVLKEPSVAAFEWRL